MIVAELGYWSGVAVATLGSALGQVLYPFVVRPWLERRRRRYRRSVP